MEGLALAKGMAFSAAALALWNGEITKVMVIDNAVLALLLFQPSEGADWAGPRLWKTEIILGVSDRSLEAR